MTLTFCRFEVNININPTNKFNQDPFIPLWLIPMAIFSHSMLNQCQPYAWVYLQSNRLFLTYSLNRYFYITACLTLTFDLVTLTSCHLQRCMNMNTMYKSGEDPIIRFWFIAQTVFHIIANLTLIIDLVTLNLCHLQCCINVNPMYKFDHDPINRSWFIA